MTDPDDPGDTDDGLDYAWVMQTTFVLTVVVGAPVVALLAALQPLPTWEARVGFAVRVGALVWIATALSVYVYARRNDVGGTDPDDAGDGGVPGHGGDGDRGSPGSDDPGSEAGHDGG